MKSDTPNVLGKPVAGKTWAAAGIFLVVLAVYALSSAGRIDIIDGQARYDVTYHWIVEGRPILADPWLGFMAFRGRNGAPYSPYGAAASVFAMPLVGAGILADTPARETSRFLFSLTSPIFGAGVAVVLFLLYLELGISLSTALLWTSINALATLLWPASTSTFDNAQHAFFMLAGVYLGYLAASRNSRSLAASAGLACAVLVIYQEYFLIVVPALAISVIRWTGTRISAESTHPLKSHEDGRNRLGSLLRERARRCLRFVQSGVRQPGDARESLIRFRIFCLAAIGIGIAASLAFNHLRFGAFFENGKRVFGSRAGLPPFFGNPLAGLATLLISPGKSIFLYSPPIILGLIGMRHLRRTFPTIAFATILASLMLVGFLSCIAFASGDWCWGPRYLVPLLPLWALAFPFVSKAHALRRAFIVGIVGLGMVVQGLALSVENQRFFFERGLRDYFWADDPWFYFKHSALLARVNEAASLRQPLPPTAQAFTSVPATDWSTYSILGPPPRIPRSQTPQWMRNFKIYYLPRPWPLWMRTIAPARRPIRMEPWLWSLSAMLFAGSGLICFGLRRESTSRLPVEIESAQVCYE